MSAADLDKLFDGWKAAARERADHLAGVLRARDAGYDALARSRPHLPVGKGLLIGGAVLAGVGTVLGVHHHFQKKAEEKSWANRIAAERAAQTDLQRS